MSFLIGTKAGWRQGKALGSGESTLTGSGTFVYAPEERRAFGLNFVFGKLHYDKIFDNVRVLWEENFQPVFTTRTSGHCRNFSVSPPS